MQKSESIDLLAKALAKVQITIKPAIKDSANPFFKSKYADLTSVWDSCGEALAANGLSVAQVGEPVPGGASLTTVLMHESGQWISGTMEAPLAKQDAQAVGSCITYLRRYGLAAMVGIRTEDDDGAAASGTVTKDTPIVEKPVRSRYA
jgi:hypothetical protein